MNIFPSNGQADLQLEKCLTGIKGLDEILEGGLPQGRPTLVCGSAGCGKTLLACEFLVNGATLFNEPGVLMSFEETPGELAENLSSLGINLKQLEKDGKIFTDYVHIDRGEIEETGEYDLEGLFIRLADAIATVGAKRVVLDTIETIFADFSNEGILRSELRRLFRWLKEQGVTAIVTGERGNGTLTRHGLEEYVSDCVILLDHRVKNGIATRLLRVVKYRGSRHGSDEFPFLIEEKGIWVMPITSVGLNYDVSAEFISSGVERLDRMLNGHGYYRGSSILVSGTAGTGKTSLAAHLVDAACGQGERCLYFAYEEAAAQIIRNMCSIGINLKQWVDQGLLHIHAVRPSLFGAEMHLLINQKLVEEYQPTVVVIDPLNNLAQASSPIEIKTLLVRMIDFFKVNGVTALFTSLTHGSNPLETTDVGVSSLMDTWLMLRDIEVNGERNRGLTILKSRGMAHSNQIREFLLTDHGIELVDVYVGPTGVLTGTARKSEEAAEKARASERLQEVSRQKRELERRRESIRMQIESLQKEYQADNEELDRLLANEAEIAQATRDVQADIAIMRKADEYPSQPGEAGHDPS